MLIMTALGTEEEKLRGFGLGADDYVVKPCGLLEILARVKALLKRASGARREPKIEVRVGDLTIDFGARTVRRGVDGDPAASKGVRLACRTRPASRARGVARGSAARGVGVRRRARRAGRWRRTWPRCVSGSGTIRRRRGTSSPLGGRDTGWGWRFRRSPGKRREVANCCRRPRAAAASFALLVRAATSRVILSALGMTASH